MRAYGWADFFENDDFDDGKYSKKKKFSQLLEIIYPNFMTLVWFYLLPLFDYLVYEDLLDSMVRFSGKKKKRKKNESFPAKRE